MADKDRCGSVLPMSCQGRADAFARNLRVRLNSLGMAHEDQDDETHLIWNQSSNAQFETLPLSPEEEQDDPLSDRAVVNHHIDQYAERIECNNCGGCSTIISSNTRIPECNGTNSNSHSDESSTSFSSRSENLEASIDDIYETASDHSADEEEEAWAKPYVLENIRESSETSEQSFQTNNGSSEVSVIVSSDEETRTEGNDSPNEITPKIRRCSSLKTGKTPPGTPSNKKIVRFADALGLDLADVKTFVDEIPRIPTSAYLDLRNLEDEGDDIIFAKSIRDKKSDKTLIPIFQQPGGQPDFLEVVRNNYVRLENAIVDDPVSFAITGLVRVRNIDFHKSVFIRYSTDSWRSFVDVPATYMEDSCDGFSDKFSFLIYANMLVPGQSIEFAVVFQARGEQFWDNNRGANYCFQCFATHIPTLVPLTHVIPSRWDDDQWGAAFY